MAFLKLALSDMQAHLCVLLCTQQYEGMVLRKPADASGQTLWLVGCGSATPIEAMSLEDRFFATDQEHAYPRERACSESDINQFKIIDVMVPQF